MTDTDPRAPSHHVLPGHPTQARNGFDCACYACTANTTESPQEWAVRGWVQAATEVYDQHPQVSPETILADMWATTDRPPAWLTHEVALRFRRVVDGG